jgi:hypothetical protein
MSLTKTALKQLAAHVQRACPGLAAEQRQELIQDALRSALEQGLPDDPESALLERAKAAVPALRNSERNRQRRGGRIKAPTEAAAESLPPVRRIKRRPHVPKGLMPMVDDTAQRVVPLTQGQLPDATTAAAARRLFFNVIEPAMAGHPMTSDGIAAIWDAYIRVFAESPGLAGASILKEEIQRAQRGLLEANFAAASALPPKVEPLGWFVDVTKTAKGARAYPDLPRHARLPLIAIRSYTLRGKVTVHVEARYNGQRVIDAFVEGTYGDVPPAVLGTTPAEHATGVMARAVQRATELGCVPLPDYLMDPELIAVLIERAGFDGGGGAKLSGPTLLRLLADPHALADDVEAFGCRHAERLSDDNAYSAEARYRQIANRIRERTGCHGA